MSGDRDGYVMPAVTNRTAIMAWSCSGTTNAELISNLIRNKLINSDAVAAVRAPSHLNYLKRLPLNDVLTLQAMTAVDRANYVPDTGKRHAYEDSPQCVRFTTCPLPLLLPTPSTMNPD